MTRSRSQANATKRAAWSPSKFVDQPLLKAQSDECRAWHPSLDEIDTQVQNLLDRGYAVKFGRDMRGGGYACYVTQTLADGENLGWTLPGRGSTPIKALKQALYKHYIVFDAGEWGAGNSFGYDGYDD